MTVEYLFPNYRSKHYDAFLDSIPKIDGFTDKEKIESINDNLSPFSGRLISVSGYRGSIGILGIEFTSEEDFLYFKLKFN